MEIDLSVPGDTQTQALDKTREYLKCKMSTLYFIENYIQIPVTGGYVPVKDSDLWWSTPKYRQFVIGIGELDAVQLMSSRQHGKTTTVLMVLLHYMLFFPKIKIEYVTLDASRAQDAISRMNDMISRLPKWLIVPRKGKSEKVTYLELENGSRMNARFVSGNIDPDKLGRGMSAPIIYIDETAFIPKMDAVWAAMQPAISAARTQAKKNNYPSVIIFTTTPNGAGDNYFYSNWSNAFDRSEVFEDDSIVLKENYKEILESDPNRNNFVNFKIHWSETNKDEAWYQQQVRELNFRIRKINQEINLVFLGSSSAVFDDEVLESFIPADVSSVVTMSLGEKFTLFENPVQGTKYILGVDVAASTAAKADWSAFALIEADTGRVIGEWKGKFSVLKRFTMVIKSLIRGLGLLFNITEDDLVVVIERNSFGLGVIEDMIYDEDYDYGSYLYWTELKNDRVPGMQTDATRREKMFNLLLSLVTENPKLVTGRLLQEELRNLEQKQSGRYEAAKGTHDDLVMAYNFTLFVRADMIKKGLLVGDSENTSGGALNENSARLKYFLDISLNTNPLKDFSYKDSRQYKEEIEFINNDDKKKNGNGNDNDLEAWNLFGTGSSRQRIPSFEDGIIMF